MVSSRWVGFQVVVAIGLVLASACSSNDGAKDDGADEGGSGGVTSAGEAGAPRLTSGGMADGGLGGAAGSSSSAGEPSDDASTNEAGAGAGAGAGGAPSGDSQCTPFEACGGDPTGEWDFQGLCFLPDPLPNCPELQVTGSGTAAGTYSVSSQQTSAEVAVSTTFEVTLPVACLDGTSCADAFANFGSSTGAIVEATLDGDRCIVNITQPSYENTKVRAITIGDAKLVDDVNRETAFCRDGDRLRIKDLDDNPFGVVYTLTRR